MASFTITVPDAVAPDVLEAFAWKYGWTDEQGTKAVFARQQITNHLKAVYAEWKVVEAKRQAEYDAAVAAAAATSGVSTA